MSAPRADRARPNGGAAATPRTAPALALDVLLVLALLVVGTVVGLAAALV